MFRIEHIEGLPRDAWDQLIDDEHDPFGVGDDATEWRRKELFTVLYDGERPSPAAGSWSWRPTVAMSSASVA